MRFDPNESSIAMHFLWGLLEKSIDAPHSREYYLEMLRLARARVEQVLKDSGGGSSTA